MLSDAHWMSLEPLVEACRPKGKTQPKDLRRTLSAIVWRHQNGAKWRAIPAELGPWSRAAQTFIRWARLGVWERLLLRAQERGVQLGMTFLDGTSIRAHQKAAGARRKGAHKLSGTGVRRWAARVVALGARPASSPTVSDERAPSSWRPVRRMNSRMPSRCLSGCRACRSGWWPIGAMPVTPFASISGPWAHGLRSRPSAMKSRLPARSGSTPTATRSSGSGPV